MDALRDVLEALRPVVHRVHGGHVGQQGLCSTDVGGRALATNVLLTGLECEPVGGAAGSVLRHAHNTARHLALELLRDGHEGCVRATKEEGHTEALGGAEDNVRAHLTRGFEQKQGQRVRHHGSQGAAGMQLFNGRARIHNVTFGTGVGEDGSNEVFAHDAVANIRDFDLELDGAGALSSHGKDLWMQAGIQQNAPALLHRTRHEADGFGGGRGFVEKRGVCDGQAGEGLDHGLEIEQSLKAALGNLRLVGRVRGVPAGIFQQTAADDRRGQSIGISLAVERLQHDILRSVLAQLGLGIVLTQCIREVEGLSGADGGGEGGIDKRLNAVVAHGLEHRRALGLIRSEVARDEIHVFELLRGVSQCGLNRPQV